MAPKCRTFELLGADGLCPVRVTRAWRLLPPSPRAADISLAVALAQQMDAAVRVPLQKACGETELAGAVALRPAVGSAGSYGTWLRCGAVVKWRRCSGACMKVKSGAAVAELLSQSCCRGAAVAEPLLVAGSTPSAPTRCCAAPCASLSTQLRAAPLAQHQPGVLALGPSAFPGPGTCPGTHCSMKSVLSFCS